MGRGLISGLIWGSVFSLTVLLIAAVLAPVEKQTEIARAEGPAQDDLDVPAGSEFNRERPEMDPVLPEPDEPPVAEAPLPTLPGTGAAAPPAADTAPADQPEVAAIDGGPATAPVPEVGAAPRAPSAETPTTLPMDVPEVAIGVPVPEIENPVAEPDTRLPQIGLAETEAPAAEPAPAEDEAPDIATGDDADEVSVDEALAPVLGALTRNAVAFEGAEGRPIMSIVLVDVGAEGLDIDVLKTFGFPVSFAIDPTTPNARQRAEDLRDAGFEVIALTPSGAAGIAPTATPADVETALATYFNTMPRAVALLEHTSGGLRRTAPVADQVIAYLSDSGHGLLTFSEGLNTTHKKALREGVPASTVFRTLDEGKENPATIGRYLDRAAFRARNEGQVVMLGHTYADTVKGLFEWALSDQAETVVLAPVSALLRAQQ